MEKTSERSAGGCHSGSDVAPVPLLLAVADVARLLNCSERHVYRLSHSRRMPKPLKLGSLIRWKRTEVDEWLADGCPDARPIRGQ